MFERFTESARRAIFHAREEADRARSPFIEPQHLLLGVVIADPALIALLGVDPAAALTAITIDFPPEPEPAGRVDLPLSHLSKRCLAYAAEEARFSHLILPGHLLLGLLSEASFATARYLGAESSSPSELLERLREICRSQPAERPKGVGAAAQDWPETLSERLSQLRSKRKT